VPAIALESGDSNWYAQPYSYASISKKVADPVADCQLRCSKLAPRGCSAFSVSLVKSKTTGNITSRYCDMYRYTLPPRVCSPWDRAFKCVRASGGSYRASYYGAALP